MLETEIKLSVHPSFMVPSLDEHGSRFHLKEGPLRDLRATYYDTEDLRLARSGVTLRYRSGEPDADGWTLKLPVEGSSPRIRNEMRIAGSPTSVPDEARDLTTAFARSAPLMPVARLRTRRRTWSVIDETGEEVAELADDEVSILEARRVIARFREIEIESRGLDAKGLEEIAAVLGRAGAVAGEPIPKAVRALGPHATAPPDVPAPTEIDPDGTAGQAVSAALAAGVRRLTQNDPLTRSGDVEGLHQQRVAARRLRSDLRTFGPLLQQSFSAPLVEELKWLGGLLGEVRDLDVLQARLRSRLTNFQVGVTELLDSLAARHEAARAALLKGLRSDRYKALLEELVEAAIAPALTEKASGSAREVLPSLVIRSWRRLAKNGRSLEPHDAATAFHEVRIRAKRARYAAEAVAPGLGATSDDAWRFAAGVADIQGVLGAHQDAVIGQQVFEEFARRYPDDGPLNLAMGRLIEREVQEAKETRDRFFKVWKNLDRKKNLRWLAA